MSRWKRGATKAIITNALTKSTGGLPPPAQVRCDMRAGYMYSAPMVGGGLEA